MRDSIFRPGHHITPLVGWLIYHMDDRTALEKRLRGALLDRGIRAQHWRGVIALSSEANVSLTKMLDEEVDGVKRLEVLSMIGRCEFRDGEVGVDELEILTDVLSEFSLGQFGNAAKIVREWLRGSSKDSTELQFVLRWWLSSGSKKAPKGGWDALLRQTAQTLSWASPMNFPAELEGVAICPLTNGTSLSREGMQMDNCLERAYLFDYARRASCGELLLFHLFRSSSPQTCATLSIQYDEDTGYSICEFETVGRGNPPQVLRRVAHQLIDMLNTFSGFVQDDSECLEDLLGETLVPWPPRRRVRRPHVT